MARRAPVKPALEIKIESLLAPYAARSSQSRGRRYPEDGVSLRNPFQRDRDRIIHSTAFRRLQYKTQVFVNHEGDHYRTRLTHTLETSQISRSIARVLGLHEDLAEAISLAHDIGHGPFGHAGEWALQELMKGKGGFEHNLQSLRIVEQLEERYPDFPGLNLCFETLQGLQKHPVRHGQKSAKRFRTLEADLVDLADEIAYASHDLDDGLRSGLLEEALLADVVLWKDCEAEVLESYPTLSGAPKRRLIVRLIIDRLVKDTVETSRQLIAKRGIQTLADLQRTRLPLISLSEPLKRQHAELKRFLRKNLYLHCHVVQMTEKGQRFLKSLFRTYMDKPGQLPPEVLKRADADSLERAICDYMAGMTDRFAIQEYKRFFEPYE